MLGHAALADSMTEVQGAVPHHVVLEGLPTSIAVPDFATVTATADQAFVVLQFAELFQKIKGFTAQFQ